MSRDCFSCLLFSQHSPFVYLVLPPCTNFSWAEFFCPPRVILVRTYDLLDVLLRPLSGCMPDMFDLVSDFPRVVQSWPAKYAAVRIRGTNLACILAVTTVAVVLMTWAEKRRRCIHLRQSQSSVVSAGTLDHREH